MRWKKVRLSEYDLPRNPRVSNDRDILRRVRIIAREEGYGLIRIPITSRNLCQSHKASLSDISFRTKRRWRMQFCQERQRAKCKRPKRNVIIFHIMSRDNSRHDVLAFLPTTLLCFPVSCWGTFRNEYHANENNYQLHACIQIQIKNNVY